MNTLPDMTGRDGIMAGVLTLAVMALLCACLPSLRPVPVPLPPAPPIVMYCPATPPADSRAWRDRNPALIALSAAVILPADEQLRNSLVMPPLHADSRVAGYSYTSSLARKDNALILPPSRPMKRLPSQRVIVPEPAGIPRAPAPHRVELAGDWRGRSPDIAPLLALDEPAGPWSFTAVLSYDAAGRVRHALLESAALEQSLRNEVVRRLYQCRVMPVGAAGEGKLTVSGPGRAARP